MPPKLLNSEHSERRVGFEFEFSGVGLENASRIIHQLFGGTIEQKHRFVYAVRNTPFGDFSIESDASLLTKRKWRKYAELNDTLESLIATVSEDFVPFEIVTPPIPLSKIGCVEDLRKRLQEAGAQGTNSHFFSAYGFQFNPEMPDMKVNTFLNYMRAFILLYDRLLASEDIPIVRRILPYIDRFPDEYVEHVLDANYRPTSMQTFMRDYLEHNPTRNRALDWLPLFAHLDKDLVFEYEVERELIKPRPTLHYRLPSSLIDDPNWSIAQEWNKWVEIERLASDPVKIEQMSKEYLRVQPLKNLRGVNEIWMKRSEELIDGGI